MFPRSTPKSNRNRKSIGGTEDGLTGTQIGDLLAQCGVPDVDPAATKWRRLFHAFAAFQNERHFGNHLVVFINQAMNPVRFTTDRPQFNRWRDRLNVILAFSGMSVRNDGRVCRAKQASNLDEAIARAGRLQYLLESRGVHPDVLLHCKAEWLQENYFHAVFEATKSIAAKLRALTGHPGDGAALGAGGPRGPEPAPRYQRSQERQRQKRTVRLPEPADWYIWRRLKPARAQSQG